MQDVKQLRRWMVFKLTPRPNGTVEKQPLSVLGGFASSNDPATWSSYEDARKYCVEHTDCSLGFVLGKEVGLAVVDIDKARASKEQPWPAWVEREVEELDSFTEESVSGLGLHVWVWGSVPANRNNQKCHVEVHDSAKMFCVSQAFAERWEEIKPRDLSLLYRRIDAGEVGPSYHKPIVAYAWNTGKFEAVMADKWQSYFTSRSDAVQSALWTLARKHEYDAAAMRKEFEASPLRAAWEDKWERLGDREIERAIKEVKKLEKSDKAALHVPLTFSLPVVAGEEDEFVLKPLNAEFDGWFPRGAVSIIAGASGAGKTSLMTVLLHEQHAGKKFLGHDGAGLNFLTIFFDRKRRSAERTLKRLGLADAHILMEFCSVTWGAEAIAQVLDLVERHGAPPVVFVEGGDMIVQKPSDISYVAPFVTRLQEIAEHYHSAVVLSLGSPKKYEDRKVILSRDNIFGSQVWGRMTDTVAILNHEGDGTEELRTLIVQHRDAPTEKFEMQFANGRLVPRIGELEDADELALWAREEGWFTRATAEGAQKARGWLMSRQAVGPRIEKLMKAHKLERRRNAGGVMEYRWKRVSA